MIRGEYWIHGYDVEYADGDVADFNHESIATNYIAENHLEKIISLAESLEIDTSRVSQYNEYPGSLAYDLLDKIYKFYLDDVDDSGHSRFSSYQQISNEIAKNLGIDLETLNIIHGKGNSTLYVMQHENWVAVRGNNIEYYGLNQSKLKGIAVGISEILHQEEIYDDQDIEFSMYDHKTKRSFDIGFKELESGNIFRPKTLPQTKANYILPDLKGKQYGRENWRGTSETISNKKMNFKFWLEGLK
jgi:hypothetical protein